MRQPHRVRKPASRHAAVRLGRGSNDSYIQGFADPFSVNVGGSINFKIQTAASSYSIDIYRMGYYGGDGARLITSIPATAQNQPACNTNTVTGLVDCGNWSVSATWNVPATAVSGVYFAHIYTSGTTHENQIPFVVTNNASTSNIVFMTSDETWQAYNDWGGYSLYTGNATGSPWCCTALDPGRATQVSYNRPFATRYVDTGRAGFLLLHGIPDDRVSGGERLRHQLRERGQRIRSGCRIDARAAQDIR